MEELTNILQKATRRIGPAFFRVPIDGGAPVYRERTYCYELYHQMRCIWPSGSPFTLNGELDKRGHPLLAACALDGTIPDFLVHQPGRMEGNHAIIEVKTERAQAGGIANDLLKLARFRRDASYQRALYLVFGEDVAPALARIQAVAAENPPPCPIEVWTHAAAGAPAHQAALLGA